MHELICVAVLALCLLMGGTASANPSVETEQTKVPVEVNGVTCWLDAKIYKPVGEGPFPIMVVSHGAPRNDKDRQNTRANEMFVKQCELFAQNGFATILVVRRGYGISEGKYTEVPYYTDSSRNYMQGGLEAAKDIMAAVGFMQEKSYADKKRVVLLGQSAGGHSSIAASSLLVDGLLGVVNCAGGRGSYAPGKIQDEDNLILSWKEYGKTSRVPSLWLYAENDQYFSPELVKQFYDAFDPKGEKTRYIKLPPYGEDGHATFARAVENWYMYVMPFLVEIGAIEKFQPYVKK